MPGKRKESELSRPAKYEILTNEHELFLQAFESEYI